MSWGDEDFSADDIYRAAQRGGAAFAEAGRGGAYEWYAFLRRWGSAEEIGKHLDTVADLARWWLSKGPDGPETLPHLSALLDRLQALHRTALEAERGLGAVGLNPTTGRLLESAPGGGAPPALKTLAIQATSERFTGRAYRHPHGRKRLAAIRAALAHAFPPEDLTDDAIRSALKRAP